MAAKSYLDLKREVWDTGKCAGCGACTAICPADALYFDESAMVPNPKSTGYCKQATDGVSCGACYEVCPRVIDQPAETLGEFIELVSAKAAFDVPGKQSGGAVTAILSDALATGLIDAVVTVTGDPWTLRPSSVVITSSDVLISQAGSRYSWWVPLLAALRHAIIDKKYRRIAVVGVPCVVQAVGRMRESRHDLVRPYAGAIRLVIGLFCTEIFDYDSLIVGKLKTEKKIDPSQIRKMDVKGKMEFLLHDGTKSSLSLEELESCIRPGCRICTDFTSVYADISAGAVGSPAGATTLVIRTPAGKNMVDSAIRNNRLLIIEGGTDKAAIVRLAGAKIRKNRRS